VRLTHIPRRDIRVMEIEICKFLLLHRMEVVANFMLLPFSPEGEGHFKYGN
jgi:hypothetical protein